MKTARFLGNKIVKVEEKERPVPKEGQVLIKVKSCGLCGSEREQYMNGYHHQQGHELSGIIEEVGPGCKIAVGTKVVAYLTGFCGKCENCKQGLTTFCTTYVEKENIGWAYPGGFAEYVVVPEINALPLDEKLSFEEGVLLLDTLGTPFHGLRIAEAEKAKTACVIGCGTVGLGSIVVLKSLGVERVYASDMSSYRLEKAEEFGAIPVKADEVDLVEFIRKELCSGVDIAVEAAGIPATLRQALKITKPLGKVLCLGEQPEDFKINIDLNMRLKDQSIIRSWYFPVNEFYKNAELMKNGFFKGHEKMISHVFDLDGMQEGCDLFYSGKTMKVLINP